MIGNLILQAGPSPVEVVGILGFVIIFTLGMAVGPLRRTGWFLRHRPSRAADVTVGQWVTVEGTAEPITESATVTSPVTADRCLVYDYTLREQSDVNHIGVDGEGHTETIDDIEDGTTFVVSDDSGEVRVDPTGLDLFFTPESLDSEDEDRAVRSSRRAGKDFIDDSPFELATAKMVRTGQLDPGEDVYVHGIVEERRGEPTLVASDDDLAANQGLLADARRGVVLRRRLVSHLFWLCVLLLVGGAGVGYLVFG